jgi:hypothetical protein
MLRVFFQAGISAVAIASNQARTCQPPICRIRVGLQERPDFPEAMMHFYLDFEIETFELGADLWHACFRNIDRSRPIMIDEIELGKVHVGVAWPTPEAAVVDARAFIDRMVRRLSVAA